MSRSNIDLNIAVAWFFYIVLEDGAAVVVAQPFQVSEVFAEPEVYGPLYEAQQGLELICIAPNDAYLVCRTMEVEEGCVVCLYCWAACMFIVRLKSQEEIENKKISRYS